MKKLTYIPFVGALGILSSCTTLGPEFKTPDTNTPDEWTIKSDKLLLKDRQTHNNWWLLFKDPALNELVTEARKSNQTLQLAGLRIFEARAALGRARSMVYPQSQNVGASVSQVELSRNADLLQSLPKAVADETDDSFQNVGLSFDAFWELDLWGKIKRGIEASDAKLMSEHYNYEDLMVTLLGDVTTSYLSLRTAEDILASVHKNVAIQKRSLEIVELRFKKGLANELSVMQARALLYNTQARAPYIQSQITSFKNTLCLLLGRNPGQLNAILAKSSGLPHIPKTISTGIPSELIRRRPDVRKAEKIAAAQCALIGMAEAELYPAFQLSGTIGIFSDSGSDLFESDSIAGAGGFGFMWKILNYGRLKNRIRIQDARFQQTITAYQMTVINAAREVDTALTEFINIQEEAKFCQKGAQSAERAVELALTLYRDGLTDYTTVIDTQRVQLKQQDALIFSNGMIALKLITAYKAMGGGWQLKDSNPLVPDTTKEEMQKRSDWDNLLDPIKE